MDLTATSLCVVTLFGVSGLALATKALDFAGTLAGLTVGSAILFFGGWEWFLLLLTFFVVAGLSTRFRFEQKRRMGFSEGLGGTRGWKNVLANGGLCAVFAVAYGMSSYRPFLWAYIGAVSTSMADTLATEFGLLNPYEPRLITDLGRTVPAGTSGGVSLYGEAASLLGSTMLSAVAWFVGFGSKGSIVPILGLASGFLGSSFDSLLGATIQVRFACQVCGRTVEKQVHCGRTALPVSGVRFMDNNVVNFLATLFGAASCIVLAFFLLPFGS
jgi:uncharacterized protein (TIGR00297 family)